MEIEAPVARGKGVTLGDYPLRSGNAQRGEGRGYCPEEFF